MKFKDIEDCQQYKLYTRKLKEINPNVIITKFINSDDTMLIYCLLHQIEYELYKKQIYKNYSCPICKTQRLKNKE